MIFVVDFNHMKDDWTNGIFELKDEDKIVLCMSASSEPPKNAMEIMDILIQSKKELESVRINKDENYINFQIVCIALDYAMHDEHVTILSANPDFQAVEDYHDIVIYANSLKNAVPKTLKISGTKAQETDVSSETDTEQTVEKEAEEPNSADKAPIPINPPDAFESEPEEIVKENTEEEQKTQDEKNTAEDQKVIWNALTSRALAYEGLSEADKDNLLEEISKYPINSLKDGKNAYLEFRTCMIPAIGRKLTNTVFDQISLEVMNEVKKRQEEEIEEFLSEEGEDDFIQEEENAPVDYLEDTSAVWPDEMRDKIVNIAKKYNNLAPGPKERMLQELEYADEMSFDMLNSRLNSMFAPRIAEEIYDFIEETYKGVKEHVKTDQRTVIKN